MELIITQGWPPECGGNRARKRVNEEVSCFTWTDCEASSWEGTSTACKAGRGMGAGKAGHGQFSSARSLNPGKQGRGRRSRMCAGVPTREDLHLQTAEGGRRKTLSSKKRIAPSTGPPAQLCSQQRLFLFCPHPPRPAKTQAPAKAASRANRPWAPQLPPQAAVVTATDTLASPSSRWSR